MSLPKVPAACADLDLSLVERVLAKHLGDIPRAAKELGVSGPDLNRLTWAKPKLLEEAELERMGIMARAWSELIRALHSDEPRRREWAAEKILSSYAARDHPFAPARRGVSVSVSESRTISFRWQNSDGSDDKPATESFEREGQTFTVPKYGDGSGDGCLEGEVATPATMIEHAAAVASEPEPAGFIADGSSVGCA